MKKIITVLLCVVGLNGMAQDCKSFTDGRWHIVYNIALKKYAIASANKQDFLCKDEDGEYGVYGEGWEHLHCSSCASTSKSLFSNPCDAKQFIINYSKFIKEDNWK